MHASTRDKWKAIAAIELMAVMIALVLPVTPSKTGPPGIPWPESLSDYFADVLLAFVLINGVYLMLALIIWGYSAAKGLPFWAEHPAQETSTRTDAPSTPD